MVYENKNLIENKKPFETIYELEERYNSMHHYQCQLQVRKQLPERTYRLFVETITWLEKYIELTYKNGFLNWENPKQIGDNLISERNDIYEHSKRAEETFLNQLHLLEGILKNDASSEFRRELKQEFNKWIKTVAIDFDYCVVQ